MLHPSVVHIVRHNNYIKHPIFNIEINAKILKRVTVHLMNDIAQYEITKENLHDFLLFGKYKRSSSSNCNIQNITRR